MDKEISKKIFIQNKILTPSFIKYSFDEKYSINKNIKKIRLSSCNKTILMKALV